ncbi:MAG: F0F1 ATP synthase subunit A [Phycisphaeraceae bacterium]|nr:F0F1 ATP synthase subunit A [Phycisphaeraceae bacterium]
MMIPTLTLAAGGSVNPLDHVVDHPFITSASGYWIWSSNVGTLVLSGLIMIFLFPLFARRISTGPQSEGVDRYVTRGSFSHTFEVICTYLRDATVRPLLGSRTDAFMPFLWTLFFFILINNLLGLIPIIDILHLLFPYLREHHIAPVGGTATQNIWVTGSLALIAAVVINLSGVRELGIGGYLKHLTAGTPAYLWPLMIPIEILGTIIKPVALAIRLFANMTAGHTLIAVLFLIFVGQSLASSYLVGIPVTALSALVAVAINFLELFVAFLQAFVFMFLTTVFIAQLSHHHDHGHDEAHDHEHAHA